MARLYHVEIARHAARADAKWIDNLLSRFDVPGVERARQGITRRISIVGIYHIVLIHRLSRQIGLSTQRAVSLATAVLANSESMITIGPGLELRVHRAALEREVDHLVAEAAEMNTPARRGRPRKVIY